MRIIKPDGIVRSAAATNSADGNSEYLLNLRPVDGTWRVMGEKESYLHEYLPADASARKVYIHQTSVCKNLILLRVVDEQTAALEWTTIIEQTTPDEEEDEDEEYDETGTEQPEVASVWKTLLQFEAHTDNTADLMKVCMVGIGNYLSVNTPALHTFLFNTDDYETVSMEDVAAPPVCYAVEGRYTDHGTPLTDLTVKVRGADKGGCYFREYVTDQYAEDLLTGTSQDCVGMQMGSASSPKRWGDLTYDASAVKELLTTLAGEYKQMQTASDEYREGYVLVCAAWQLADGSVVSPSEPVLLHLGCEQIAQDFERQLGRSFNPALDLDVYYNRDKIAIKYFAASDISSDSDVSATLSCYVRRQWVQRLLFSRPSVTGLPAVCQKVVYYVSAPLSMYDVENADFDYLHTIYHYDVLTSTQGLTEGGASAKRYFRLNMKRSQTDQEGLPQTLPSRQWLADVLLYKAVEFDLTDSQDAEPKAVNFDTLQAGDVLKVDSNGRTTYSCGGMMTHCRRLHIFDYTLHYSGTMLTQSALSPMALGWKYQYTDTWLNENVCQRSVVATASGSCYWRHGLQSVTSQPLYAVFRLNLGAVYAYHYCLLTAAVTYVKADGSSFCLLPPVLSFPDSRADSCTLCWQQADGTWGQVSVPMYASSAYNFSFALNLQSADNVLSFAAPCVVPSVSAVEAGVPALWKTLSGQTLDRLVTDVSGSYAEAAEQVHGGMKVSLVDNPQVFPPALSFVFDDRISALSVSSSEISLAQAGQYPLMVFTDGGIWAMQAGTEVFYAAQTFVSSEVNICPNTLLTPFGIVFVSKAGVMMLNGRQVSCLSLHVQGAIVEGLNRCAALVDAACGHPDTLTRVGYYRQGVDDSLLDGMSAIAGAGAVLGYDATHRELIVSNHTVGCPCSYVYSFAEKMWYGVSFSVYSVMQSGIALLRPDSVSQSNVCTLCDLSSELFADDARPVLWLTRPLALGELEYKTVGRAVLRGEFSCSSTLLSGFYLLASNDLQNWQMVSGVQWNDFSTQARIPRSHWSWRYYSLLFCGDVQAHFALTHAELQ